MVTNNNVMTEGARVLFPLILNRMSREGQMTPNYIGKFPGVSALPRDVVYPATYFWVDTSLGAFVLSVNNPLIHEWAQQESNERGLIFFDEEVMEAIEMVKDLSARAFQVMVNVMPTPEGMPSHPVDFS